MIDQKRQLQLQQAIELLFYGYRAFTTPPDRILAQKGLGRVHHRILYFVGRDPDLPLKQLLARLAVSKQALNGPLRQLAEMGLIDLRSDPNDGRVKLLRLSRAGERLEAQLTGTQMKQLDAAFKQAGATAEAGWREVMELLSGG